MSDRPSVEGSKDGVVDNEPMAALDEAMALPALDESLPLRELDRALAPVRRVLAFAVGHGGSRVDDVRFLEANSRRWVHQALALDLPTAIRDALTAVGGRLDGLDELDAESRRGRVSDAWQELCRTDAALGLPLPIPNLKPRTRKPPRDRSRAPSPKPSSREQQEPRKGRSRRGRGRSRPAREASVPQVAETPVESAAEVWRRRSDSLLTAGVDLQVAAELSAIGVETVQQLLLLSPLSESLCEVHGAGRLMPSGKVAVSGRVSRVQTHFRPGTPAVTRVWLKGAGETLVEFASPTLAERALLEVDSRLVVVGTASEPDESEVGATAGQVLREPEITLHHGHDHARLLEYGLAVADRAVRGAIRTVLCGMGPVDDPIAPEFRTRGLMTWTDAVAAAHVRGASKPEARRRLAFDELFFLQLGTSHKRFQSQRERGIPHRLGHGGLGKLDQLGLYRLTDDQQLALEDIKRDLRDPTPMRRLLSGPPGSGKALIATCAVAVAGGSKSQAVWITPNASAAEFRAIFAEKMLEPTGLISMLVVGEPTRSQRNTIRRGEVHVVFGTPDLFEHSIEFRRLGFVIAEEEDACGVVAASVAALRAPFPDLLVLNPVPLGPEVWFQAYSDFDISAVRVPVGPTPTQRLWEESDREQAFAAAARHVEDGRQAVVVFPMSRDGDLLELRTATRLVTTLRDNFFGGVEVGLIHGAMSKEERYRVFREFQNQKVRVLVATTCIEYGDDLAGVGCVIVEQANHMDVVRFRRIRAMAAELHCIVGASADEADRARVRAMAADDATELVSGAVTVTNPAPKPAFSWLGADDLDLIPGARARAHAVLRSDPALKQLGHPRLARELADRWEELSTTDLTLSGGGGGQKRRRRRRKRKPA